jgi:hypothetical protein
MDEVTYGDDVGSAFDRARNAGCVNASGLRPPTQRPGD